MSPCATFIYQLSRMSKWLAKHISTKVSFKITIRKRHDYIDIRWTWNWIQYFYLGISIDDRTKMIVLPSFQLVTRLNSQNTNYTEFINELWHINSFLILEFPIGIIDVLTPLKWSFFTLFQFITRLLTTNL